MANPEVITIEDDCLETVNMEVGNGDPVDDISVIQRYLELDNDLDDDVSMDIDDEEEVQVIYDSTETTGVQGGASTAGNLAGDVMEVSEHLGQDAECRKCLELGDAGEHLGGNHFGCRKCSEIN